MTDRLMKHCTHLLLGGVLIAISAVINPAITGEKSSILDNKNNGYYTAKVGAKCTTRESFATVFSTDLERVRVMFQSEDHEALRKLQEAKRLIYTKAGVVVFVEERYNNNIKVRPQGEVESLWMPSHGVECAAAVTKKSK